MGRLGISPDLGREGKDLSAAGGSTSHAVSFSSRPSHLDRAHLEGGGGGRGATDADVGLVAGGEGFGLSSESLREGSGGRLPHVIDGVDYEVEYAEEETKRLL